MLFDLLNVSAQAGMHPHSYCSNFPPHPPSPKVKSLLWAIRVQSPPPPPRQKTNTPTHTKKPNTIHHEPCYCMCHLSHELQNHYSHPNLHPHPRSILFSGLSTESMREDVRSLTGSPKKDGIFYVSNVFCSLVSLYCTNSTLTATDLAKISTLALRAQSYHHTLVQDAILSIEAKQY